jgi:hypothetical protein
MRPLPWKSLSITVWILLAAVGFAFTVWTPLEMRSKRIHPGMTQDQLAAVMGRQPDATGRFCCLWREDREEVWVSLSSANPRRATGKQYVDRRSKRKSLADKLLDQFRLLFKL